jgi:hypothetical protein
VARPIELPLRAAARLHRIDRCRRGKGKRDAQLPNPCALKTCPARGAGSGAWWAAMSGRKAPLGPARRTGPRNVRQMLFVMFATEQTPLDRRYPLAYCRAGLGVKEHCPCPGYPREIATCERRSIGAGATTTIAAGRFAVPTAACRQDPISKGDAAASCIALRRAGRPSIGSKARVAIRE